MMKVSHLMTSNPLTCSAADSVADAAVRMWNGDCGALPVVDDGCVTGVITDRDICMALAMRDVPANALRVAEIGHVNAGEVQSCDADDDIADALQTMAEHQVRRLPVLESGKLVGVLSLNDTILEARSKRGVQKRPTYQEVAKAMQAVCSHRDVMATT